MFLVTSHKWNLSYLWNKLEPMKDRTNRHLLVSSLGIGILIHIIYHLSVQFCYPIGQLLCCIQWLSHTLLHLVQIYIRCGWVQLLLLPSMCRVIEELRLQNRNTFIYSVCMLNTNTWFAFYQQINFGQRVRRELHILMQVKFSTKDSILSCSQDGKS